MFPEVYYIFLESLGMQCEECGDEVGALGDNLFWVNGIRLKKKLVKARLERKGGLS